MTPRSVSELLADPAHAGPLAGAAASGSARLGDRHVSVGLWLDAGGRVERARFRATSCASLIAYAEAACVLAEASGLAAISAERLHAAVSGVHPLHVDRAELVARALADASSQLQAMPPTRCSGARA